MSAGRYAALLARLDDLARLDPFCGEAAALAAAALRESEEENARLRGPASVEMADVIREVGDLVLFRDDPAFGAHVAALETRLKAAARAEVETLRTEIERWEDFSNEIVANCGDEWDGDEAQETIAIRYVRWLEAEAETLRGEKRGLEIILRSAQARGDDAIEVVGNLERRAEAAEADRDQAAVVRDALLAERERMVAEVETLRTRAERAEGLLREMLKHGEHEGPCTPESQYEYDAEPCEFHLAAARSRDEAARAFLQEFADRVFAEATLPEPGNGDMRCPHDGELVNVRCWRCGWVRPATPPQKVGPFDLSQRTDPFDDWRSPQPGPEDRS